MDAEYGYVVLLFSSETAEPALHYAYRWLRGNRIGEPVLFERRLRWDVLGEPEYLYFKPGFYGLGYRAAGAPGLGEALAAEILGAIPLAVEEDGEQIILAGTPLHPYSLRFTPGFRRVYGLAAELIAGYGARVDFYGTYIDSAAVGELEDYLRGRGVNVVYGA